jgi:spore maturation protein CgeB
VGKNEYWLPLAADTDVYKPINTQLKHDVAFCGTFLVRDSQAERNKCLKALTNEQYKGGIDFYIGRDYNEYACLKYNQSRMVFNMGIGNDINMRLFEAMASNVPVLYNHVDGLEDLGFKPWEHYLPFTNEKDVLKAVYLGINMHEGINEISNKAYKEVKEKHTYLHRVNTLLDTIFK